MGWNHSPVTAVGRRMRAAAFAVSTTLLLAGCSIGSTASGGGSSRAFGSGPGVSTALTRYHSDGVSFAYPATWRFHRRGFVTTMTSGIINLSTQRLGDPCHPVAGGGASCGWPLHQLRQGGVIVMWTEGGGLLSDSDLPPPGIDVQVTRPGSCLDIGGDETVSARAVTRRHRRFSVIACMLEPGDAANEQAVRAMLASLHAN
jgi:hypothetical protein